MCLRDHTKTLTLELPFLRSLAISSNRKKRPPSTPPPPSPTGGGPKRLIVADHIRGIRSPNDVLLEMPPVGYAGGVLAGVPARLPALYLVHVPMLYMYIYKNPPSEYESSTCLARACQLAKLL